MQSATVFLAALAVVVLGTVGCQQQPEQPGQTLGAPTAEAPTAEGEPPLQQLPPPSVELQVTGELQEVDLTAQTVTLSVAGTERLFTFSDATTVRGASGPQGLATEEGSQVTVRYREDQGTNMALDIELLVQQPQ
jgi:hypothetical protein